MNQSDNISININLVVY